MRARNVAIAVSTGIAVVALAMFAYRRSRAEAERARAAEHCAGERARFLAERRALTRIEHLMEDRIAGAASGSAELDWGEAQNHASTYRDGLSKVRDALDRAAAARHSIANLIRAAGEPYNQRKDGTRPNIDAERERFLAVAAEETARAREEFSRVVAAAASARGPECGGRPDF